MKYGYLVLLLFSTLSILAEEHKRIGAVEYDNSDRYLIESKSVGDDFRIDVIPPIGYAGEDEKYPVVYVTDANYLLPSAAASYLAQATGEYPKVIIVGIGWNVPSIARIRVRDFSPTCDAEYQAEQSMSDEECGQADPFVAFIKDELQPFIEKNYRTTDQKTLVGYSFGGLFALHVLFNHPEVFDNYVIGSAAMNWDEKFVFRSEEKYAKKNKDLAKRVYLSSGALESFGIVPNTHLMYEQLLAREYPNLKIKLDILADETHMTGINSFAMRGLGYTSGAQQPRKIRANKPGYDTAIDFCIKTLEILMSSTFKEV